MLRRRKIPTSGPSFSLWPEEKKEESISRPQLKRRRSPERKCEAFDYMVKFINKTYAGKVKTALDAISGGGLFAEYLLQINGLGELRLNAAQSKDHYDCLRRKFGSDTRITRIFNIPPFHICLGRRTDLVVFNFLDFSWYNKEQADQFLEWIKYNRQWMHLLIYADNFPKSLDEFLNYPSLIERNLSMKIITHYPYNDRRLVLLEYE